MNEKNTSPFAKNQAFWGRFHGIPHNPSFEVSLQDHCSRLARWFEEPNVKQIEDLLLSSYKELRVIDSNCDKIRALEAAYNLYDRVFSCSGLCIKNEADI